MPLSEPSWWYGPDTSVASSLLRPAAAVYGWVAGRRMQRTDGYRCNRPVICVGNLTAGGTGKTPLSLRLASEIRALGASPVFLTRGYGGREVGPIWVDPSVHGASEVGDEALLLAKVAPTVLSRRRDTGAQCIEAAGPADAVIIMDDGLQNPQLQKDLSIAVVDGLRGIGNGRVIPAGPLRAHLDLQLGHVDAIVINTADRCTGSAETTWQTLGPAANMLPRFHASPEPTGDVEWLRGARVIAFAGIANPERFFRLIERLGAELLVTRVFRDHEPMTPEAARELLGAAQGHNARLVTTTKDLARLVGNDPEALAVHAYGVEVRLEFDERDMMALRSMLASSLSREPVPTSTDQP